MAPSILVTAIALAGLAASGFWASTTQAVAAQVVFNLFQVVTISIVIWQACDPFADTAQYFGERWRLPGSVRGATLDAIASSLPELFTGLFFVFLAAGVSGDASDSSPGGGETEGLGATIATCAGSAVYNMMLIPALCGIVIAKTRAEKPVIEVESKVISRDGLWFLACELVLILFLFQPAMTWPMGMTLLGIYVMYVYILVLDSRRYRLARDAVAEKFLGESSPTTDELVSALREAGISPSLNLIAQVKRELQSQDPSGDANPQDDQAKAGFFFGRYEVALTPLVGYAILAICTLIAAAACYWLVEVTQNTAQTLQVPLFFVAVIVAAAASSVPDTFLSIAAAKRGDDDGAVSNAFGSNIFDICVCLSVPLLVSVYLNGGKPIELTVDGKPMVGLFGLQVLLCASTVITLLVMWQDLRLTVVKSWVLVALYGVFVAYAIAGSLGILDL